MFRILIAAKRWWRLSAFRAGTVLAVVILLSRTVYYRSVEGWSWIDALHYSATTVYTVGYGDLPPEMDLGKIITVIYMFAGIGVFVLLFAQLAGAISKIEFDE